MNEVRAPAFSKSVSSATFSRFGTLLITRSTELPGFTDVREGSNISMFVCFPAQEGTFAFSTNIPFGSATAIVVTHWAVCGPLGESWSVVEGGLQQKNAMGEIGHRLREPQIDKSGVPMP